MHVKDPRVMISAGFNIIILMATITKELIIFSPDFYFFYVAGELTEAVGGVYDVSNLDRLGTSEVEQVNCVIKGVKLIIEMEKRLEKGESIDDLIPQ